MHIPSWVQSRGSDKKLAQPETRKQSSQNQLVFSLVPPFCPEMRKRIILPEDLLAIANSVQATGAPKMKCASASGLGNSKTSKCQPKEAAGAGIELQIGQQKIPWRYEFARHILEVRAETS